MDFLMTVFVGFFAYLIIFLSALPMNGQSLISLLLDEVGIHVRPAHVALSRFSCSPACCAWELAEQDRQISSTQTMHGFRANRGNGRRRRCGRASNR